MEADSAGSVRAKPAESAFTGAAPPCLCDFNSELALAQLFNNQLSSPLDM